jgi:hypothetical protein
MLSSFVPPILQFSASAVLMTISIASRLGTGSDPGNAKQTGQVRVFGSPPNATWHRQNILLFVESSA